MLVDVKLLTLLCVLKEGSTPPPQRRWHFPSLQ